MLERPLLPVAKGCQHTCHKAAQLGPHHVMSLTSTSTTSMSSETSTTHNSLIYNAGTHSNPSLLFLPKAAWSPKMSSSVTEKWKHYSQAHGFQTAPQNSLRGETSAWVHLLGCRWAADQHQVGGIQLEQSVAKPKQQWPLPGEGHGQGRAWRSLALQKWGRASWPSAADPARRKGIWWTQQSSTRRWLRRRRWGLGLFTDFPFVATCLVGQVSFF